MKNRACVFSTTILVLVASAAAPAQEKPQGPPPAPGRGNMGRPIWNVDDEGHTPKTWASNLYHFAQRILR